MNPRAALKSLAERVLGAPAVVRGGLARLKGARLILAYHNVIADDTAPTRGDVSLHLPLRQFRSQLDAVTELGLRVAELGEPVDSHGDPEVVITFDDAYAGTLELALPELTARALPSTVFVAPGILGSAGPWWDQLAAPVPGKIPTDIRQRALEELAGQETRILEAAHRLGWLLTPPLAIHRIANEDALNRAIVNHPLLTIGAHSWNHPNLARLTGDELARELSAPRDWLSARYGSRYVDWLAYPYGRCVSATESAVESAGYRGAVLVTGGWDRGGGTVYARPRLNVTPGISASGFRARLAGLR